MIVTWLSCKHNNYKPKPRTFNPPPFLFFNFSYDGVVTMGVNFSWQEDFIPPPPMDETASEKMDRISATIKLSRNEISEIMWAWCLMTMMKLMMLMHQEWDLWDHVSLSIAPKHWPSFTPLKFLVFTSTRSEHQLAEKKQFNEMRTRNS